MEKLLQKALQRAKQAEVYLIEEESLPVAFNDNQIARINAKKTMGISLRVVDSEGRLGIATASNMDREDLVERAMLSAEFGGKTEIEFPNEISSPVQCYDPYLAGLSAGQLIAEGQQMLETVLALDPSIHCDFHLGREIQRVKICNSSGLNVGYEKTNFNIGIVGRSEDGFRENSDMDIYSKHFTFTPERLEQFVRDNQLARTKLKVKTGKMDIILTPGAIWPMLYRLFAGVNGAAVNRGISPLKGRLGEQIFSPLINIVNDPTYPFGMGTTPYDDEGSVALRTLLVEKGVLQNYLFDLDSAHQYGTKSTGNGFKKEIFASGIDLKPEVYVSNLMLLPGESKFAEMVQSVKHGLIVNQVMGGHTGNVQAGEFGLNIANGYLVEDGEVKGKVVDAMISGNIYDLFKRVTMVGDWLRATQAVFYGFGYTPAILVPELVVAASE